MKYKSLLVSACTLLMLVSCGGDKPTRPTPALSAEKIAAQNASFEAPEIPSGGVTTGVDHYTCPNGHAGAAAAGNCLVCGSALEHNQAFHDQPAAASTDAAAGGEPPQNAEGVWHYTCPNGHDGGAGSATPCSVCGTTLVHNTVYHNSSSTPSTPIDPLTSTSTSATQPATTPPAPTEPAQNLAGVWHYTCPNGHEGGGGSATPCGTCGTTLVHNTAYHN